MIFHETGLQDAWLIELERNEDDRGFFARSYCAEEFSAHGLATPMVQGNVSYSAKRGTLRGMHYQIPPMLEAKYIRTVRGEIFDAIIDLRPWSPTYLKHFGVELSAENRLGLYVPPLFAHGHQTLVDDVEITYMVSSPFTPGLERGLRHDDSQFNIAWPIEVAVMSDKDRSWADFDAAAAAEEMNDARNASNENAENPGASS